jgi:hypothetical protein
VTTASSISSKLKSIRAQKVIDIILLNPSIAFRILLLLSFLPKNYTPKNAFITF